MKSILQKMATVSMLVALGALAVAALIFASAPQLIAPLSDALRMHRDQDLKTLETFSGQILRSPPGPVKSSE